VPALFGAQKAFAAAGGGGGGGNYPNHPKWKFAFINHVTTNPFFVPTQYGASDACALVNTSYTWTGSDKADVGQMINAFNAAISAKSDGIAVCVVDKGAFEAPIKNALKKGIPVLAYNADGARGGPKARMAYIGQALYESGFAMGQHRRARSEGRRRPLHRDAGGAQHPAANRRRRRRHQAVGEAAEPDRRPDRPRG